MWRMELQFYLRIQTNGPVILKIGVVSPPNPFRCTLSSDRRNIKKISFKDKEAPATTGAL